VAKPEGDPVPDVQDLRATPDLSLVIERNPAGQPAWGDRLFRVDWSVACRKRSQADPSCGGELSWVADPVEIGWFAQRSFRAAESGEFDALWDDRSAVDASEPRAQPMSVVAYDRPALLPPSAAAEAARLRFDDPRAVRRRTDDPLVLLDSAGCAVGRLRPDLALTGWAELEAPGRSIVAYVASATEANKGDFELFNHWLRVVQVDRSGGCRGGEATAVAGFPIVEVGPFGAPPVAGIAFGPASGPLDQRLVIRHADPVGTYSAIPWSREALQATMCGILAASEGQGYPPDERYSSTAYRLLKGPEGSVFRELEGGHGVCPQQPLPHPRPVAFTTAGALASGDGSHDSTSKP
jgi:hypothetical protein